MNLTPRGKSAHWTGRVPEPVLPLPPLHTSPPSYRLYRLKKEHLTSQHRTESSILFRMVLFIFTLRRSNK